MTTGYIVFSRFDSRRLPGKALIDLEGKPLLARVLERLKLALDGRPLIVATSERSVDDGIAELAKTEGVKLFRGSAENVALRALNCAKVNRLTRFVRVCGDSPFIDPDLCQRLVVKAEESQADICTNVFPRKFPPGCSVEIISYEAMNNVCENITSPEDREHVTRYVYQHPGKFSIRNHEPEEFYPSTRLTVDTPYELDKARHIFQVFGGDINNARLRDVVKFAYQYDSRFDGEN